MEFSLNQNQQKYLACIAINSIYKELFNTHKNQKELPNITPEEHDFLQSHLGAFITLEKNGHLRGCIGSIVGQEPLTSNVRHMAKAAAFQDPRFPPLRAEEWDAVSMEISVLGPLTPCPDVQQIEVGRHGLVLSLGNARGVFLPKVPVEQGWDLQAYLENLCRKANLAPHSWKDERANLFWYEAFVFKVEK